MNKLITRTLSGIVFVAIIVTSTLWTTWSFYAIWAIIGILCLAEYYTLTSRATDLSNKPLRYLLGTIYIALPITLITQITPWMVITILTIIWMNDTGAYIVGVMIGKHKMAPKISPKKSWEGFVGGLIFAIATALIWCTLYWFPTSDPTITTTPTTIIKAQWAAFGLIIGLFAVCGDLIESKFKRTLKVKDSGNLIPGHGGILDRFDAALLAIPFAWIMVKFWIS